MPNPHKSDNKNEPKDTKHKSNPVIIIFIVMMIVTLKIRELWVNPRCKHLKNGESTFQGLRMSRKQEKKVKGVVVRGLISTENDVMGVDMARGLAQMKEDEKMRMMMVEVRVHARWWSSGGRNSGRMEERECDG